MDRTALKKALDGGVRLLRAALPDAAALYVPLLYSACVWAARRVFDYRNRVLGWQVWLDPGTIQTKPDDFIRRFFESEPGLAAAFAPEIASGDRRALRRAFAGLYPVVGIEDPFLRGLFRGELAAGDYRTIAADFGARAAEARDRIRAASEATGFWDGLGAMGMELASLGIHLLSDAEVLRMIEKEIRKARSASRSAAA